MKASNPAHVFVTAPFMRATRTTGNRSPWETTDINAPPRLIERSNGSEITRSESSPSATVVPEMITERQAWVIVWTSADSTSFPSRAI